jgi:hypothetical protein
MSWTTNSPNSRIFQQAMLNPITRIVNNAAANTGQTSLTGDTINVAVYNNTTTPDATVSLANSCYNAGTWSGNEITGTNWSAGGVSVGTTKTWTIDSGSSSLCFQVTAPTAGQTSTANVTLAAFFGCLVYDTTPSGTANPGVCYNYFGGTQTVTAATFTIMWATPASAAITAIFNIAV